MWVKVQLKCREKKNKILDSDRGIRVLSRAIYRKLKDNNFSREEILKLIGEIMGLVTADIKNRTDGL